MLLGYLTAHILDITVAHLGVEIKTDLYVLTILIGSVLLPTPV